MRLRILGVLAAVFLPLAAGAQEEGTVLLGKYRAEIVPEQVRTISLPEQGVVTGLVSHRGRIAKGTVIARVNADQIELKQQEMENSILRERVQKKDEIRKLEKQRSELEFYSSLPSEQRKYATRPGEYEPTAQALADLDERINLTRRELASGEERKRMDFRKMMDSFIVKMPYDGRLQYHFTVPEDLSTPVELEMGKPFITVCNDAAFYIAIGIAQSEITQLPGSNLSVEIALPEGKKLCGTYARRRVEQGSGSQGAVLTYYFKIPEQDADLAYSMLGSMPMAKLWYRGSEDVILVNKKQLALDPRARDAVEWGELAAVVYPDCHVIVVADDYIILRKKK